MKKVTFSEMDEDTQVIVEVDGVHYGNLFYDYDQEAFVLWPDDIDDGVTYFDSLNETEKYIRDELTAA